jgi:hypothetical protein
MSDERTGTGTSTDAGASTDQHITGQAETGQFQTDKEPAADTPADGSTNAGINETEANRQEPTD